MGRAIKRSLPFQTTRGPCEIFRYTSGLGPLASLDASPYPLILNRVPDSMPGGIENLTFLFLFNGLSAGGATPYDCPPFPLQAGQSETLVVNGPTSHSSESTMALTGTEIYVIERGS